MSKRASKQSDRAIVAGARGQAMRERGLQPGKPVGRVWTAKNGKAVASKRACRDARKGVDF